VRVTWLLEGAMRSGTNSSLASTSHGVMVQSASRSVARQVANS
jgi:hypothetical protein